jgi:hypothetical protein
MKKQVHRVLTRLFLEGHFRTIAASVIILLFSFLTGCSNNGPVVKGSNSDAFYKTESFVSQRNLSSDSSDPKEIRKKISSDIMVIEAACVNFHIVNLRMPMSLDELFETGFILFWPENWKYGGAMKILSSPPELSNPDHIGNVFLDRISDNEASLKYLSIDLKQSTEDKYIYKVSELKLITPFANKALGVPPDEDTYYALSHELEGYSESQKYHYAYRAMLIQPYGTLVSHTLRVNDMQAISFTEMLSLNKFLVFEEGFEKLKTLVNKDGLEFDIGFFDQDHGYYTINFPDQTIATVYINVVFTSDSRKKTEPSWDPPDGEPHSIWNQDSLSEIALPSEFFITVDDVH